MSALQKHEKNTEQSYMTESEKAKLIESSSRVIQWNGEAPNIFLVDPAKVKKGLRQTLDKSRIYPNYTFEVTESVDGDEIERELELGEVKAGELLKLCDGQKTFVQIQKGKSADGFNRYRITKVQ